jgi:hypothetical protein
VATTDATVPDSQMTAVIHQALARRGLLPAEHYLDSGYPSAELLVATRQEFGITLVTPVLLDHSPQARAAGGYDRTAFTIDWDHLISGALDGPTLAWIAAPVDDHGGLDLA